MANTKVSFVKPALLPTPTKAGVVAVTQGQPASSQALPSSTTQPGQHNKAQADSSKKEKVTGLSLHQRSFSKVFFLLSPFLLVVFCIIHVPLTVAETTDPRESYKWSEDSHQTILPKEGDYKGGVQGDCAQGSREGKCSISFMHLLLSPAFLMQYTLSIDTTIGTTCVDIWFLKMV